MLHDRRSSVPRVLPAEPADLDTVSVATPEPEDASDLSDPAHARPVVAICEDDPELRQLIAMRLRTEGIIVFEFGNGEELLDWIAVEKRMGRPRIQLIVTDVRMPSLDGMEMLRCLKYADCAVPVIVISGFADPETVEQAFARGAAAVFDKPFDIGFLSLKVREFLKPALLGFPPHRPTAH